MLYKPTNEKLWDNWIFCKDGVYYLFYLKVSEGAERWDGISLATSDDMLHWRRYGEVLHKSREAIWLGTGMVYERGGEYIMNYSEECPRGNQHIKFAVSKDLYHWEKTDKVLYPDGRYYSADKSTSCYPYPRWDSLGIFPHEGSFYAVLTASKNNPEIKGREGTVGLVKSDNLLDWTYLPTPLEHEGEYPNYEVPEHLELNGRHYILFSTNSKAGFEYESCTGPTGGTYYVCSDNALSGYKKPGHNNRLIGVSNFYNVTANYVGRTFKDFNGRTVFYHIWGDQFVDGLAGLPKLIEEEKPFKLRLKILPEAEALKGRGLLTDLRSGVLLKLSGAVPAVDFEVSDGVLHSTRTGTTGAISFEPDADGGGLLSGGRIAEFVLNLKEGVGLGFFCSTEEAPFNVFFDYKRQLLRFSFIEDGWECNLTQIPLTEFECTLSYGENYHVEIFYRNRCCEAYIDGIFIGGVRIEKDFSHVRAGIYADDCTATVSGFNVYEMK